MMVHQCGLRPLALYQNRNCLPSHSPPLHHGQRNPCGVWRILVKGPSHHLMMVELTG
uniref:Uncharacterized protein n=1 Tax=Arundo donax TaxID=35708 RepID=A0A0A9F6J5_ARUDO